MEDPSKMKNASDKKDETAPGNTQNDRAAPPSIDKEMRMFIARIVSLSGTLPMTMKAISAQFRTTLEQYDEFEKNNITYWDEDGEKRVQIKAECFQEFRDLQKRLATYGMAGKTIPRSYVMSLVSQYDAYIGKLIKAVILIRPELLNASERNLTFAQLVEIGSVEDAKQFVLEKEIEAVLRDSHADHFAWMEKKFSMPLRQGLEIWPDFIELTERRNLFVHTDGIVSTQYLKVCKENNVALQQLKVGDELRVSASYFAKAFDVVFELGFKLGQVLWRKFLPHDLEGADRNLIEIGYEYALREENYPLTKRIFDFGTETLKKHSSEENRLMMVVNRALGYKWSGDDKRAKEIVGREDWSATSGRFKLAQHVLLDEYDAAYETMRRIGTEYDEMKKENYRFWPLFNRIRNEAKFMETFEEVYGEPYNIVDSARVDGSESVPSSAEGPQA